MPVFRRIANYVYKNPTTAGRIAGAAYNLYRKRKSSTSTYVPAKRMKRTIKRLSYKRKARSVKCLPRKTVKCVKEIVKKELTKESPTGTYYKHYGGTLLMPLTDSNNQLASDFVFWAQGSFPKQRLIFFQPHQMLDAASVLFNSKTAALPDTNTTNDIADVQTKFNVIYASAKVTIKSHAVIPVELSLYEVRSKDLENDFFGDDYNDALESTNLNQVGGTTFNRSTMHVKPTMFESLKTRYKIKEITKKLLPGESLTHFMKYKSNTLWKKQNYVDGNVLQNVGKDTVQLFYTYRPCVTPIYDGAGNGLRVGVLWRQSSLVASQTGTACLTCDVHEIYKIDCPDGMAVINQKDATCVFNGYEPIITLNGAYTTDPIPAMNNNSSAFLNKT